MTRGMKNNNAGNIRRNNTKWQGLSDTQTDKEFFQFKEMKWGLRAMMRTIQNYNKIHGLRSIREVVSRWAPPFENDTILYVNTVAKRTGLDPDHKIKFDDMEELSLICQAMCFMENSVQIDIVEFYKAWHLL